MAGSRWAGDRQEAGKGCVGPEQLTRHMPAVGAGMAVAPVWSAQLDELSFVLVAVPLR